MDKKKARLFIKKHIKQRGHQPVLVTEKLIRKWWHIFNVAVFYGRLNKPHEVNLTHMRKMWAYVQPSCIKGRINIIMCTTFKTRELFLTVLIHEMVHAWEKQHHGKMGHGKRFHRWKSRIKWTTTLQLEEIIEGEDYGK